jgi:hypothetical protein
VKIEELLGEGEFGQVHPLVIVTYDSLLVGGYWSSTRVVLKVLKDESHKGEFEKEVRVHFGDSLCSQKEQHDDGRQSDDHTKRLQYCSKY